MEPRSIRLSLCFLGVVALPLFACDNGATKSSAQPAVDSVANTPEAQLQQSITLRRAGKPKEANEAALKAFTLARSGPRVAERIELAKTFGAAGKSASAINEIKELEREKREGLPVDEVNIAEVYAIIGDPDAAFRWLDRAIPAKSPNLAGVETNPDLAAVKSDPRWQIFLSTMKLK